MDIVLGVDMRKKVRTMGSRKDERISMADFKIDAKKPDLEQMKKDLDNLRALSDIIIEHNRIQARILREKYLVLISEGFTPQEAIELCKVVIK